jgi:hypothetical protein
MQQRGANKRSGAAIRLCFSNCFSSATAPETEGAQTCTRFYSTLALSSSLILQNSTRHSVTSRIEHNCRLFSDLIFSTRQLNATPEKTPTC